MSRTETDRTTALELLSKFRRHILPGALRRISAWKGIPQSRLRDWLDDILQELALDCLEHTSTVLSLPERQRHARWMRRTEQVVYRHRRQITNQPLSVEEPERPNYQCMGTPELGLPNLVAMGNGRTNIEASIRLTGMARRQLRRQLNQLAEQLGWDRERYEFWRARVVEALTGLAADLLRAQGHVLLLAPPTLAPDPDRRAMRLRQLNCRFPVQPLTRPCRDVLRPWVRRSPSEPAKPRQLLEQAVALEPQSATAWLWLLEACCSEQDERGARRALWRASRCRDAPHAALVLGRARTLELRGRLAAGVRLLRRAMARWPRETAFATALELALTDAA